MGARVYGSQGWRYRTFLDTAQLPHHTLNTNPGVGEGFERLGGSRIRNQSPIPAFTCGFDGYVPFRACAESGWVFGGGRGFSKLQRLQISVTMGRKSRMT